LTDGLSQNASPFSLRFSSQNGFGVGDLKGVNFTEEGFVEALFSNGESRVIGQLALARFPSPEGLLPLGDQLFQQSADSGVAVVDVPLSGGSGSIVGGSLENSNVSIADEFIRLIEAQRGFQANTRVITASDQLLTELVNIIR
jgi:flagellar hook protein FlgE